MDKSISNSTHLKSWKFAGQLLLLTAIYFVCGRLGLSIPSQDTHITLFWLPSGIAVVAMLVYGVRLWPGVTLGALFIVLSLGNAFTFAAAIAAGNTMAPLATVWILKKWCFDKNFSRQIDLFIFIAAASIGMLVSSLCGTVTLYLSGILTTDAMFMAWLFWWMGDLLGVILAGPILLSLTHQSRRVLFQKPLETLLCVFLLGAAGWLVFCTDSSDYSIALAFLPLPLVLWVAMRLGFSAIAFATIELSLFAAIGTGMGEGALGRLPVETSFVTAWLYIVCIVLTGLMTTTMLGERMAVEEKLRKSEASLRSSNIIANLGSFELDLTTEQWQATSLLESIFGLDRFSDHSLAQWAALIHPEDRQAIIDYLYHEVIGGRTPFDREYRIIRYNDQVERWVHGLGMLECNAQGKPVKIHGTIQDITERKKADQLLTDTIAQLGEKELAKTRFLAAAGHDLRQPLAAAGLFIDTLKFTQPSADQMKVIKNLDQVMLTFHEQLDALLNISKLDAGTVRVENALIDVVDIFKRIEHSFTSVALKKSLGLKLYFPMQHALIIHTDMSLICSVLMNLVSNAIKYTAQGSVLLSARRRGDQILFQVWDTGIGIRPDHLEKIYTEFYQIDNPQRDRSRGLGLGLPIAKRALELLGGKLECRSRLGHGSVFGFCLPLNHIQYTLTKQSALDDTGAHINQLEFVRGKRFVVLEDDVMVMKAICGALEAMGAEVACYLQAEHALCEAQIGQADYYIVDYMLGGELNGIEFLDQLYQRLARPVQAVITTGNTSPEFVRSIPSCRWSVLHKPVSISGLIARLAVPNQ